MRDTLGEFFYGIIQGMGGSGLAPHAVCLLYDPALIAAEVVANLGTVAAYLSISTALVCFLRAFPTIPFRSVAVMFAIFIATCGLSHVTRLLTLFVGGWTYWLDVAVCSVMAVASAATALLLLRNAKRIIASTAALLGTPVVTPTSVVTPAAHSGTRVLIAP